ncbi:unnamed protein product [Arctogadus glacialis]
MAEGVVPDKSCSSDNPDFNRQSAVPLSPTSLTANHIQETRAEQETYTVECITDPSAHGRAEQSRLSQVRGSVPTLTRPPLHPGAHMLTHWSSGDTLHSEELGRPSGRAVIGRLLESQQGLDLLPL